MSFEERLVRRIAELERRVRELEARDNLAFNASNIQSGTLGTDRFSAFADLQAESKIGLVTGRIPDANAVRMYTPPSEAHDFTSTSLPSGWQWAGSPFVTPTLGISYGTWLTAIASANNQRVFMYRSPDTFWFAIQNSAWNGSYIGVRFDDNTDNNYIEVGLKPNLDGTYTPFRRVRTGGGTVVEETEANIIQLDYRLSFWIGGTQWSNYVLGLEIYYKLNFIKFIQSFWSQFTPVRAGIVMYLTDQYMRFYIDAIG